MKNGKKWCRARADFSGISCWMKIPTAPSTPKKPATFWPKPLPAQARCSFSLPTKKPPSCWPESPSSATTCPSNPGRIWMMNNCANGCTMPPPAKNLSMNSSTPRRSLRQFAPLSPIRSTACSTSTRPNPCHVPSGSNIRLDYGQTTSGDALPRADPRRAAAGAFRPD